MEVAVRDAMMYTAGHATAVGAMRALGVTAVEVAIDKAGIVRSLTGAESLDLTTDAGLAAVRAQLKEHGVRICAFLCSQNFNAEDRAAQINWVVQAVRAADALGVPALRIDSAMTGQADLSLEDRIRIFADAVSEVLVATPGSTVALGIENHGRQGNDPEWMRGVISRVGSSRLGLTLDVGNWYWYGHPLSKVYEIYREFGALVKATHVKNIAYPVELRETQREIGYQYGKYCCPLDEGDLSMARVAGILRECGYDGPLTIEDESLGKYPEAERAAVLQRDVDHLKSALPA
jgi:sugar phosphate isomerase/epimerase